MEIIYGICIRVKDVNLLNPGWNYKLVCALIPELGEWPLVTLEDDDKNES